MKEKPVSSGLLRISRGLDVLIQKVGEVAIWASTLLVLLFCADVLLRYVFAWSHAVLFELEWHLFAALFLLGAPYTLQQDKHVRVDIFYAKYSPQQRAWLRLLGVLLLLLPFCGVVVYTSCSFVEKAWQIGERSVDPAGLPARYIIKALIPISFTLLGLQGISWALQAIEQLLPQNRKRV